MTFSRPSLLQPLLLGGITLSLVCVIFHSYLPFVYLIQFLPLTKDALFIFIAIFASCFFAFHFVLSGMRMETRLLIVIGMYSLFAAYALDSYSLRPKVSDDIFTVRTLTVINPFFVVLAFLCRGNKRLIFKLLALACLIYFLFSVYGILTGAIGLSGDKFQDVFGLTEIAPYQNINFYLGIYVVLSMFRAKYAGTCPGRWFLRILGLASAAIMFLIGDRASLVSAVGVVAFFWLLEYRWSSLSIRYGTFFLILTVFTLIAISFPKLTELLMNTVSFQRLQILFEGGDPSIRIFLFSKAVELFLLDAKNFLFGAGIDYYPVYIGAGEIGMYPHNIMLELLSEYGVMGTLLFVSPILYILYLRRVRMNTIYGRTHTEKLAMLLVAYLWTINMFTGGLRSSWFLVFFTYLLIPPGDSGKEPSSLDNAVDVSIPG